MLRLFTLLALLTVQIIPLSAEDLGERIRRAAIAMTDAYQREDSKALTEFTAAPIVKMAGGPSALAEKIEKEFAANRKENLKLLSYSFVKPDRIHFLNGQLFALIERKSRWRYDQENMDLRFNLLAISTDSGATWRFAEITSIDEQAFRRLFGFFDEQLFSEFYKYTSERCECKGGK
ncbi:MAG: hypothetical protein JNJ69_08225 [Leptospiraceae bacterium]|nr:hypothetical protein [Leptospiraceae bacterium]